MKNLLVLCFFFFVYTTCICQDKAYSSLEKALMNKEDVIELDLSGQNLTVLSDSIGGFSNLKKLKLTNNQLSELPRSIEKLINLRYLYLNSNNFSIIPDFIGNVLLFSNKIK